MVIDTSVVIAILLGEPERTVFNRQIVVSPVRLMSAVSMLEAGMVALGRGGASYLDRLDHIIGELEVVVFPFDERQAVIARNAFARFCKGRHRAGLNFGDCAVYALAISEAEPLLFKGTDFAATDVGVAREP